jgi:hypothetical protein
MQQHQAVHHAFAAAARAANGDIVAAPMLSQVQTWVASAQQHSLMLAEADSGGTCGSQQIGGRGCDRDSVMAGVMMPIVAPFNPFSMGAARPGSTAAAIPLPHKGVAANLYSEGGEAAVAHGDVYGVGMHHQGSQYQDPSSHLEASHRASFEAALNHQHRHQVQRVVASLQAAASGVDQQAGSVDISQSRGAALQMSAAGGMLNGAVAVEVLPPPGGEEAASSSLQRGLLPGGNASTFAQMSSVPQQHEVAVIEEQGVPAQYTPEAALQRHSRGAPCMAEPFSATGDGHYQSTARSLDATMPTAASIMRPDSSAASIDLGNTALALSSGSASGGGHSTADAAADRMVPSVPFAVPAPAVTADSGPQQCGIVTAHGGAAILELAAQLQALGSSAMVTQADAGRGGEGFDGTAASHQLAVVRMLTKALQQELNSIATQAGGSPAPSDLAAAGQEERGS